MQPLYDDHPVTQTGPRAGGQSAPGQPHTMGQPATGQPATGQQAVRGGGLDTSVSTGGTNPIDRFVATSNWTHDDLSLALAGLSLLAWVGTTVYISKQ